MKRKLLVILLALAMVITLMPTAVFAETEEVGDDPDTSLYTVYLKPESQFGVSYFLRSVKRKK